MKIYFFIQKQKLDGFYIIPVKWWQISQGKRYTNYLMLLSRRPNRIQYLKCILVNNQGYWIWFVSNQWIFSENFTITNISKEMTRNFIYTLLTHFTNTFIAKNIFQCFSYRNISVIRWFISICFFTNKYLQVLHNCRNYVYKNFFFYNQFGKTLSHKYRLGYYF